jgi:CubicO group peptidase (beta-lactamase class C family)
MTYVPLKYFNVQSIVSTEYDKYWREQLLRGNVHDPSAAMLGGISGNAGLFSNAYDLAILGQMWLNGGTYGGARYLSESTVKLFTSHQENSHRGLGFDKPSRKSIIGNGASQNSYGHTGFTGTCIWVDPDHKLVFVFLSNRVHPDAKNGRINSMKIRQKIHTIVYKAIIQ